MNKNILIKIGAVILLIIIIAIMWYKINLGAVKRKNIDNIEITIPLGSTTNEIANILKENKLIKSKLAFKIYAKLHKCEFNAGEYNLNKSMNVKKITEELKDGILQDPNQITITYLEGKNMRWLAKEIAQTTNNSEEDVMNLLEDEEYLDSLIEKYWFITEEVKENGIYYSLEGYLFPDTYALENEDVTVEKIFGKMLDKMEDVLSEYKNKIEKSSYSIHEILTIASIVELESMSDEGRENVASVIYNRVEGGMSIGSDVTTYYAVKVDVGERDLYQKELETYNPYNTRGPNMIGKLPIGPISSVSKASIEAAVNPADTDYLFFVADKNGKLYFTKTQSEHNKKISELQSEGLWYEY